MALPVYQSAGNGATGTSSVSTPYPASLASGDLILLAVLIGDTTSTPTTPSGFSLLFGPDSNGTSRGFTYGKISDGTETGNLSITTNSSAQCRARMFRITGTAATSYTEGGATSTANSDTPTDAGVTTSGPDRLAVNIGYYADDRNPAAFTGETGGDWTQAVAEYADATGSPDGTIDLQIANMASAGTINGGTQADLGTGFDWLYRGFAILPPQMPEVTLNTTDNTETSDTTPTVEFTGNDVGGSGSLRYNIQIDTSSSFNSQSGSPLLDKISGTDAGFANTVSGGDTDPFNDNEKISFTVQGGDALAVGTYYYRVRAKVPAGADTYGEWSATRKIHVFSATREVSSVALTTVPTNSNHPWSDGALAFTSTQLTNIDTNNATRVSVVGGATTKPYVLQKFKFASERSFTVSFDGQVDVAASSDTISRIAQQNSNVSFNQAPPNSTTENITFNSGTTGSRRVLVVMLTTSNTNLTISSATYNGVALTPRTTHSGNSRKILTFYLVNPTTGSNTLQLISNESGTSCVSIAVYAGVDQTSVFDATDVTDLYSLATNGGTDSTSITTNTNGAYILNVFAFNSIGTTVTENSGQTNVTSGSNTSLGQRTSEEAKATAGAETTGYTNNSAITAADGAVVVMALKPHLVTPSIKLDLWNFDTSAWVNQDEETNPTANTDFALSADKTTGYAAFADASGWVYARVYANYLPSVTLQVDQFVIEAGGNQYDQTYSETVTLTGTLIKTPNKNLSQTVTLTATLLKIPGKMLTQTISLTDTFLRAITHVISNTINLTATFNKSLTRLLTLETVTLTATGLKQPIKTFAQTVTLSDTFFKIPNKVLTQTVTLTATLLRSMTRAFNETVNLVATLLKTPSRTLAETINLTDTVLRLKTQFKTLSDTTNLTDTLIRNPIKVLLQTVTLTDTLIKSMSRIILNTITFTATLAKTPSRSFADTVNLTDTFIKLRTAFKILSDTTTITDTLIKTPIKVILNTVNLTSTLATLATIARVFTETVNLTATAIGTRVYFFNPIESVALTSTLIKQPIKNLLQTITLTATFSRDLSHAFAETLQLVAAISRVTARTLTLEVINYTDTLIKQPLKNLSQTISLTDTFAYKIPEKIMQEIITISDTLIKQTNRLFSETVTIILTFIRSVGRSLLETTSLTDTLIKKPIRTLTEVLSITSVYAHVIIKVGIETINLTAIFLRNIFKVFNENLTITATGIKSIVRLLSLETVSITATLIKTPIKVLSDGTVIVANIIKVSSRAFSDTVNLTDVVNKITSRIFTDTTTLTSAISNQAGKIFRETINLTDLVYKSISKTLTQTINLTDTLQKIISRSILNTVNLTATLVKITGRTFSEILINIASLIKSPVKNLSETVNLTASLLRSIQRTVIETVNLTATLLKTSQRIFTQTIGLTDVVIKVVNRSFSEVINLTATFLGVRTYLFTQTINLLASYRGNLTRTFRETINLVDTFFTGFSELTTRVMVFLTTRSNDVMLRSGTAAVNLKNKLVRTILKQRR